MTPLAMLFMFTALFGVTALAAWCYIKVLTDHGRGGNGISGEKSDTHNRPDR